jgi:hypothetical protein
MHIISERRVEDVLQKLANYFLSDDNIQFAFIFGSYVSSRRKKNSDLDVAIYFKSPPEGLDVLYFMNVLSDLSGKEVDVVILNSASAFLRHQVMKYGISVVIKDRNVYRHFREKTISDYDEYKYVSGMSIYD